MSLKKSLKKTLLTAAALVVAAGIAAESSFAETAARHHSTTKKTVAKHSPGKRSTIRRTSSRSRYRRSNYRYRISRMKMEPERIEEIQQALGKAGYLNQEPNGKWDDATVAAMRRYQSDNGFDVTGKPDAKSLMKLGLGPHPLSEDLDPNSNRRASVQAADEATPPAPGSGAPETPQP